MKNSELFLTSNSIADELIKDFEYPYEVLPNIEEFILEIGNKLDDSYIKKGEDIWIAKDAEIDPSATIIGPCIIDHNAKVRLDAYIRGNVIIGKESRLGHCCEIKNSILYDEVQVPHFNYVGDSIIGYKSHLGAGVILSNLKNDKGNITIKGDITLETNMRKVGAFLGDYTEVGCNSVINPGTIIGNNTSIYPLSFVRGVIPPNSIVKQNEIVEKK